MFERYTEKARRVIFFARYEASAVGSPAIGDEHLLLGLMREDKELLRRHMGEVYLAEELRNAIMAVTLVRESTPTSIDLPLTSHAKRILASSAEEAMRLAHSHIGAEHLLLGILREDACLAARLLRERGLTIERARLMVASQALETPGETRDRPSLGWWSESGWGTVPGAGPELGSRSAAPESGALMRFVTAGTTGPLLVSPAVAGIPRIGDGILLPEEGREERRYRVADVTWKYHSEANRSLLNEVQILLIGLDPSPGE